MPSDVANKLKKKSFPEVLHELLEYASQEENKVTAIVMWLPCGKAFAVLEPQKFEQDVLPKFFPQSQYSSFTRKLNRWGFRQVVKGPDRGAFHNDMFRRDSPKLCLQMSCIKARKPRALELYHRYGSHGNSLLEAGGDCGGGSSISGSACTVLTADGIEEMLRNRQRELELQKSKLNAELMMLENMDDGDCHPSTPTVNRSSVVPHQISPDGSIERPRLNMISPSLGQQQQEQRNAMAPRRNSLGPTYDVSDYNSDDSLEEDFQCFQNLQFGLQDFLAEKSDANKCGQHQMQQYQLHQQQQQQQLWLMQQQNYRQNRRDMAGNFDYYDIVSRAEQNLSNSLWNMDNDANSVQFGF